MSLLKVTDDVGAHCSHTNPTAQWWH